jgi:hypothetical protein
MITRWNPHRGQSGLLLAALHTALVASLCLRAVASIANEAPDVGVVVDYSPAGASLYLKRIGVSREIPVMIAAVMRAGDKISLPGDSSVTIELSDNQRITSSGPGIWEVPAAPRLGAIAAIFHRFEFVIDPNYNNVATAITKGAVRCSPDEAQPISVPILRADSKMKAGRRSLSLAWTGGCPPYTLALHTGSNTLRMKRGLIESQFRFENVSLRPGTYSVSITAAGGTRANFPLEALADGPVLPNALTADKSHLGAVARALWLADVGDGAWRLDCVEMLMSLHARDPLEDAVVQLLLRQDPTPTTQVQ